MAQSLQLADSSTNNLIKQWTGSWKTAVQAFVKDTEPAIATADALGASAHSAASYYADWAAQIWAVINALRTLAQEHGGGATALDYRETQKRAQREENKRTGNDKRNGRGRWGHAGGGQIPEYSTAIVGEHGPELIRSGSRRLNVFTNTTLQDEIASARHALNMLSNSAEYVAYNRLVGCGSSSTSTDNSQHFTNNFTGAILGDDAFREMIDEEVREVWRREMRLAN
jgi:hypothetical protein